MAEDISSVRWILSSGKRRKPKAISLQEDFVREFQTLSIGVHKYAVAPDPPPSLYSGCSGNVANYGDTTSPNGDIGMDAVADDLIHELSETTTDPDLSAWYTTLLSG